MDKFISVVSCMDGRIQKPLLDYFAHKLPGYFPDTITEPGPVGILAVHDQNLIRENILKRLKISVEIHQSKQIFIVAHPDCAGNPLPDEAQKEQLLQARKNLQKQFPEIIIKTLWVEGNKKVVEI